MRCAAQGTLEIEEQKLRDLRAEAAQNPNLSAQKLFYQEQEVPGEADVASGPA